MSQTADPISSPEAYRASLLAALGDKNRHVRRHDVLGTTLVIRSSCGPAGHT